jgi:hypothetical protein
MEEVLMSRPKPSQFITLTDRSDVYQGTLEGLKGGLKIDGAKGYDIFQVNEAPSPIIGSVRIFNEDETPLIPRTYTIDSVGLLNNNLRNFEEIDFNPNVNYPGHDPLPGSPYFGLDQEREIAIDASLLKVRNLGILAQNEDATFTNIDDDNLIIAKLGDPGNPPLPGPAALQVQESYVALNLQAEREHKRDLNPYNAHEASGRYTDDGEIHLRIERGVNALVTENQTGATDSDYHKLIVTGEGNLTVVNSNTPEVDTAGVLEAPLNDHSIIDASKLKGDFFMVNEDTINENLIFGYGTDHTNLAGSTFAHMDVIKNAGDGDFVDIGVMPDRIEAPLMYMETDHTAEKLASGSYSSLAKQFDAAIAQSASDSAVVWFKGKDGNTYIVDDNTDTPPTPTLETPRDNFGPTVRGTSLDGTDFALKIEGLHELHFVSGLLII